MGERSGTVSPVGEQSGTVGTFPLKLDIDSDTLASCVACGMCLPHCPTYRVTGEESASPRGRIALMRDVAERGEADAAFVEFMDACIQCRGCETACPAGVHYGHMMEATREALTTQTRYQPRLRRLAYRAVGMPRLLGFGSRLLALAQRLGVLRAARLIGRMRPFHALGAAVGAVPRIPLRQRPLRPSGDDVWLFTGCVMDAWMRDTHRAVQAVIEATGAGVALPPAGAACCGSLHLHAGLASDTRRLARKVMAALPGEAPILIDSAGCGATMKEYGHLLGTEEAHQFAGRVQDVHEWLAARIDDLPAGAATSPDASGAEASSPGVGSGAQRLRIAVQDPCHLRHVQQAHLPVRAVLSRFFDIVELDDDGLCCGAGGAYSQQHPEIAGAVRERKVAAIERTRAGVVASANPGCTLHLQSAGLDVRHPLEIVAEHLDGGTQA
ncbi:(Fe-S)-binding protein [Candidatus Poriferisodalis sp.]|uniref:(Fe-S)-binding protein n=1 Tax=Candidatus Poriferisodalis sp. TaxID=3101277 RepID=UPI003B02A957